MTFHSAARAASRLCLVCLFLFLPFAQAQEGHPMSGVWVGDWGFTASERNRVVVILDWTGTELTGTINPGPNALAAKSATADPTDWRLRMEVDAGQGVTWSINGTIDDLGTYNRTIAGSWNAGAQQGTFSITRQ